MLLIVPWRDMGCEHRRDALAHVQGYYYGHDIHLCDTGGDVFSRSDALNAAVQSLRPDVVVALDADLLIPDCQLNAAVRLAVEAPGMVVPFTEGRYLSEAATGAVYDGANPWLQQPRWLFSVSEVTPLLGGCNVLSFDTFDRAGGWPDGFAGWGHEDVAFAAACAKVAPLRRVAGPMVHLHHPKDDPTYVGAEVVEANRRRLEELTQ